MKNLRRSLVSTGVTLVTVLMLMSTQATLQSGNSDEVLLIPAGAAWNYLDDGSDPATAWRDQGYDDSAWARGHAQLGYGEFDEVTVVSYGPDPTARYVTTYFRRVFQVGHPSVLTNLTVGLLRDDGAIVYLNGQEVFRSNMPEGTIDYMTLASTSVGGMDERTFFEASLDPGLLQLGPNVLAVEVHQNSQVSSDLSFDLWLKGQSSALELNWEAVVELAQPTSGLVTNLAQPIVLQAEAEDPDGTVAQVDFYANGVLLATDSAGPYEYSWADLVPGLHTLLAVAMDDAGGQATSAPVQITLVTNLPPRVAIVQPADQASYVAGDDVVIEVSASHPDGAISTVEFYGDELLLGTVGSEPYVFTWAQPSVGPHTLQAVGVDNGGVRSTSGVVEIVVAPLVRPGNDNFADRWPLGEQTNVVVGDNFFGTRETGEPVPDGCNPAGRTVWWSYTAPTNGLVRVFAQGESNAVVWSVYSGAALPEVVPVAFSCDQPFAGAGRAGRPATDCGGRRQRPGGHARAGGAVI